MLAETTKLAVQPLKLHSKYIQNSNTTVRNKEQGKKDREEGLLQVAELSLQL